MRPALVLIDLQRDYLDRVGLLPVEAELVANVAKLLNLCRQYSVPVFHVMTLVHADGANRMPHWVKQHRWDCLVGTPGAQPPPELAPVSDEPVFSKPYFSAFDSPDFVTAFAASGVDTLILCGIYTHACIRASALDGYRHGYEVWVATDAVGSTDQDHARLTLDYIEGRVGTCLTVAKIADQIISASVVSPASSKAPRAWLHHNPAQWNEILSEVPLAGTAEVAGATQRAAKLARTTAQQTVNSRRKVLSQWLHCLMNRKEQLVQLLVLEIGKPIKDARAEFEYAIALLCQIMKTFGEEAPETGIDFLVRRCPIGVVGLITPWNNPLAIPVGKLGPALAYGNTVVWKPALQALQISSLIMASLDEAGLGDQVGMVTGDSRTGGFLIMQEGINAISFTGSVAAGRQVAAGCAATGKTLQGELGGNNAVLVMADVDPEQTARQLAPAIFSFAGQRCTAPRRLIVEESVKGRFEAALVDATLELKIGLPQLDDTQVGPVISREQQTRLAALTAAGRSAGGRLLCGGKAPKGFDHGCWFEPTLIADPDPASVLVQEESFGPIAVVLGARNFDQALALCNNVQQGLVATIFSGNTAVQQRFLESIQAGIVAVNRAPLSINPAAPFGGWRRSGIGAPEHGRWDREFYTKPQAVYGA